MSKLQKIYLGLSCCLLASACTMEPVPAEPVTTAEPKAPRNLVFMLGDGMGHAQVKAYRMFADDLSTDIVEPLPMDALLVGAVSTDSIKMNCDAANLNCKRDPHGITDSASSATAYATGYDTITGRLGVDTEGQPLTTILEDARRDGKSAGLVSTSQITHASPAAFGVHVLSRRLYNDIADQLFDNQHEGAPMVNVMLGGGLQYFQRDDRDLLAEFSQAGYQVATDSAGLQAMQGDRLLGLFAPVGLPRAWDRDETVPSLAEMTTTALTSLSSNSEGFFLMIEGSQIDWASHGNSVAGVISEMEDFTDAIQAVLNFAEKDGETLVVIVADHETGGMGLSRDGYGNWVAEPLKGLKATPSKMTGQFLESEEPLSSIVAANVAFELTADEIALLDATEREEREAFGAIADLLNERTHTGWTTGGHTGIDVPLYATGPGSEHFRGVMQNEDIGRVMKEVFLPE
ncbi:MAG: alkaline phosphatase [Lysobacterales bacterium]